MSPATRWRWIKEAKTRTKITQKKYFEFEYVVIKYKNIVNNTRIAREISFDSARILKRFYSNKLEFQLCRSSVNGCASYISGNATGSPFIYLELGKYKYEQLSVKLSVL